MAADKSVSKLPPPEALSHVIYEMWMMAECVLRLTPPLSESYTRVEKNLNLEGFVLHMRCLDEFFQTDPKKKTRPDDITPEYFGFNAAKELYRHRVAFMRMHKEISHISHSRKSTPADKTWRVYVELAKILPVCFHFLKFIERNPELMAFPENPEVHAKALNLLTGLLPRCRSQVVADQEGAPETKTL